jgi:hypothetical protein
VSLTERLYNVGDPHPYFLNLIEPKLERLEGLGIPAAGEYQKRYDASGSFDANTWLRELHEIVLPLCKGRDRVDFGEIAESLAAKFQAPIKFASAGLASWEKLGVSAEEFLASLNLPFPQGKTRSSALLRLQDVKWWRRQMSTVISRSLDQHSRQSGTVHRNADIYISDPALAMYRKRKKSTESLLDDLVVTNDIGQEFKLSDLANGSVCKRASRRIELMVRLRGAEEWASQQGMKNSLFITLTAPSNYHCHTIGGANSGWNETNPRAVNDYFNSVWSRIRAKLARQGAEYFGMRVAEPHHDGTPHWHFIVHTSMGIEAFKRVFNEHAFAECGAEKGARKHRVKYETIDPAKGSAAAYIAKYVAKNIDGYGVEKDNYNGDAASSAERIEAWARIWGIRQFQFFGTAAIGVWRELRRRRTAAPAPYEAARVAADTANFCTYINESLLHNFKVYREISFDEDTGEVGSPHNEYGELKPFPIKGVIFDAPDAIPLITRVFTWTLSRISKASEALQARTCVSNCTPVEAYLSDDDVYQGRNGPPVLSHYH